MNDNNFSIRDSSEDDIEIKRNESIIVSRKQANGDISSEMFDSKRKKYPKSFVVPQDDIDERKADEIQTLNDLK